MNELYKSKGLNKTPLLLIIKGTIVSMVLLLISNTIIGQHENAGIDTVKLNEWISKSIAAIKSDTSLGASKIIEPEIKNLRENKLSSYRVSGPQKILCLDKEQILLFPHSSHEDAAIGDICIALTESGECYINYGHICGGIIHYINNQGILPLTTKYFFDNYISDTDNLPWIKWN